MSQKNSLQVFRRIGTWSTDRPLAAFSGKALPASALGALGAEAAVQTGAGLRQVVLVLGKVI